MPLEHIRILERPLENMLILCLPGFLWCSVSPGQWLGSVETAECHWGSVQARPPESEHVTSGAPIPVICSDNLTTTLCAVSYNVWAEIVVLSVKLSSTEDNSDPEQDEKWAVTWTILICNTSVRINSLLPPVRHSLSLCVNRQPILHSLGLPILGLCCEPFLWPWHILCQCLQCQYNARKEKERDPRLSLSSPGLAVCEFYIYDVFFKCPQ